MLRKIRRNMARKQLKEEGATRINRNFSVNWKSAYVRRLQKLYSKEGKMVYARRNES